MTDVYKARAVTAKLKGEEAIVIGTFLKAWEGFWVNIDKIRTMKAEYHPSFPKKYYICIEVDSTDMPSIGVQCMTEEYRDNLILDIVSAKSKK